MKKIFLLLCFCLLISSLNINFAYAWRESSPNLITKPATQPADVTGAIFQLCPSTICAGGVITITQADCGKNTQNGNYTAYPIFKENAGATTRCCCPLPLALPTNL